MILLARRSRGQNDRGCPAPEGEEGRPRLLGGLDTSIIIPCSRRTTAARSTQSRQRRPGRGGAPRAAREGAQDRSRLVRSLDLEREFLTDYVWPCLRAMAVYEGRYLLGLRLARPSSRRPRSSSRSDRRGSGGPRCTARGTTRSLRARLQGARPGPDRDRPVAGMGHHSREDALAYGKARKIPVTATRRRSTRATATSATSPTRAGPSSAPTSLAQGRLDADRRHRGRSGRASAGPACGSKRGVPVGSTAARRRRCASSPASTSWPALRSGPDRHRREPPRRHEVARPLRDARRDGDPEALRTLRS